MKGVMILEIKNLHTHVDIVTRSKGASVIAKAAYNARDKLNDEHYGKVHDYSKKEDLVFSKIFLPEHIPKEFSNREYLWNSVEKIEKSKNSQLARNLLFTLPRELNEEDRIRLISEFIEENFTSKGMIADCNIHNPLASDNEEQPHAHILLTLREIDSEGKWKPKCRKECILDENGEKIKLKSGNYKTRKIELTDWNDKGNAEKWRENFASLCNQYLEKNHQEKRVDHRSYKRQGIEEIPTIHLGASASALEKKGIETDKGNINREIKKHNSLVKAIKNKIKEITSWIDSLLGNLQAKYDEYKQTKKDELENKAELFNLYEYISIYNEIQGEKIKNLSYYGQIKKGNADLKRFVKAIYYLKDNHLQTIADLQEKVIELAKQSKKISGDIQSKTQRIKDLNQCVRCIDSIKENKEVYQEYKSKTIFKDSFYNSHKKEIDRYLRARKTIEKFTGTSAIKSSVWQKEILILEKEIQNLTEDKAKVQDEFKQIDHIKYAVKIVNDEYGIDLIIEIDKAIKRGDKPSVIAQLKKFQEQEERKGQYKQKAKEKAKENYKNKGEER